MKAKYFILLALLAMATVSFTFVNVKENKKVPETKISDVQSAPIGGFALDDEF